MLNGQKQVFVIEPFLTQKVFRATLPCLSQSKDSSCFRQRPLAASHILCSHVEGVESPKKGASHLICRVRLPLQLQDRFYEAQQLTHKARQAHLVAQEFAQVTPLLLQQPQGALCQQQPQKVLCRQQPQNALCQQQPKKVPCRQQPQHALCQQQPQRALS